MCDAIQCAYQLGRLDLVSALVASIGVIFAIGGIFSFINIKNSAKATAEETAQKIAHEKTEFIVNAYLQEKLPSILESYKDFIANHVEDSVANHIANAQEDKNDNK